VTSPLRIAVIASNKFPIRQPFTGGLEAHVWHLSRTLAGQGHRVTLFAERGSDPALNQPGLTLSPLTRSAAARHPFPLPGAVFDSDHHAYLRLMSELVRQRRSRFDVIHNHSLHQVPIAMARRLSTPMLTTLHTPPFCWLESAIAASGGTGLKFAAVSRHTARVWGRVVDDVVAVPNGVDIERWPAGPGGSSLVWSGRITAEKGPHLAIAAAARAGRHLILAGPVGNVDYFRRDIVPHLGENVSYAGHLDQRSLATLMGRAAAVLVTPLWDEPYCLVVAEALACGTPVVAFARGGIPEIVDLDCGRLVKSGDVAAMAAAIPEAISLARKQVREHAIGSCSDRSMVARYLAIYRTLIDERNGSNDDRLLRAPSRQRPPGKSDEHLRTPA
jgi:glycosyltransferase involved in cell wall biosynthesis